MSWSSPIPPEDSQTASSTRSMVRRRAGSAAVDEIAMGRPNMKSTMVWTRQAMSFSMTTSLRAQVRSSEAMRAATPRVAQEPRSRTGSPRSWASRRPRAESPPALVSVAPGSMGLR